MCVCVCESLYYEQTSNYSVKIKNIFKKKCLYTFEKCLQDTKHLKEKEKRKNVGKNMEKFESLYTITEV